MDQHTLDTIYTFIRDYIQKYGYAPSIRDIGKGCHIASSNVSRYLDHLEKTRRICRGPGTARSIRLLDDG